MDQPEGIQCCVCESGVEVKYRCPGCDRRTCCLECVKKHKEQFGCTGVKRIPSAPVACETGEKYNEELFGKDYSFLEAINAQIGKFESEAPQKETGERGGGRDSGRLAHFKKIQKVSKLAELRMLPAGFSRCKLNRTHFIEQKQEAENCPANVPEKKSSRLARIAWTIDFIEYGTCKTIETVFDIPDDTKLGVLLGETLRKPIQSVHLKNETRLGKEIGGKWREIGKEELTRTIAQILVGGRCFEYPQFGICFE